MLVGASINSCGIVNEMAYLGQGIAEKVIEHGGEGSDAEAILEIRHQHSNLGDQ